ncbi:MULTISPECIES: quinone-dependent dihydroorotate dehydrogenase [unclassified Colwellia]|uniref:quinone-dependent dihydroorotate dehydrogenase n=1 Tax=unclassified Colwellia TaxID=196834 RepID=UPI0015F4E467|nr:MULTISPECIES: quinone-dependent dihydroorotate dehydrogenase [unclassified Colwellia]MBA6233584.1 quinone-dependent dihydroorotate dehydrogenase [Colwellia sp. MB02u-7]MBA6238144.1 quinone-dependent dihydroorotate dehydrogenase [Colwellia sp. MB02u-11]MBA6255092.1 quinone-dependent dihydroorotate dehydrogenase [Colwellia sp. MB3u-28]MBA6258957.1 quinone-dependent dihydroorotate dehydrogenase [Colwellia sp. MB3u-41]MBA6299719.1 quinone-dependent dihydroorotate dehydrogenase [Colwellia sp. MB
MFYSAIRKVLFKFDPETIHEMTIKGFKATGSSPLNLLYKQNITDKPVEAMGIVFPNPVGLAAGLDKNGECINAFAAMGFGFVEIGTVTPKPQPGNPKPRIFRLPSANAVINRMGFNNKGVDYLIDQVRKANFTGVLGINIGKNKDTPDEHAKDDYLICMRKVYNYATYITINISSPNTPGLRSLQYGDALNELLAALKAEQKVLADQHSKYVPLAVKIAPDLTQEEIESIADCLIRNNIDGVIATNTTLSREGVEGLEHGEEQGGLSGKPVKDKSTEVIRLLAIALDNNLPIIGVGGISSGRDAQEKMTAGAKLVQVYTGFIYQGPELIKDIVDTL